jgi:copper chaperone CopZ
MSCSERGPVLDAWVDGELPPADLRRVESHLAGCAECRGETAARAALKRSLGALQLPPARTRFRAPSRWAFAAAISAAAAVLVLFAFPRSALPDAVALGATLHERYLAGKLPLRELGLRPALADATLVGGCPCPAQSGIESPFMIYRKGGDVISLLVCEGEAPDLPASARRLVRGGEVFVFKAGPSTVVACRRDRLTHLWISRLGSDALVEAILATPTGRRAIRGERLSLKGVACNACCETLESRVRAVDGVHDAVVDLERMELVVSSDGRPVDLRRVLEAVRQAGFAR